MASGKKIVPAELDKLSPLEITTKFGFEGTGIDVNNKYWFDRIYKMLSAKRNDKIDKVIDYYSSFGDPSLYDSFQNLAALFGYMVEGELEGMDEPQKMLLPLLQRDDLAGYRILAKQVKEPPEPSVLDDIFYLLAEKGAWEDLVSLLEKSEAYLQDEVSFRFLPLVLANAPVDIAKQVASILAKYAGEAGISEEWKQDILPENASLARIIKGELDAPLFEYALPEISLRTAVATGKPQIVRKVIDMIDLEKLHDPDAWIISGAIEAGQLHQSDLDQMDLTKLQNGSSITNTVFRTFGDYPNEEIYRLLQKNKIAPQQNMLRRLVLSIPSYEPLYIDLVNDLEEAPNWETIDKEHPLDKQAHLILAKRFPDYLKKLPPRTLKMHGDSFEGKEQKELLAALQSAVPGIEKVKQV